MKGRDQILLAASGGVVFLLTVGAFVKDHHSDWRVHQDEFAELAVKKLGEEKASALETGIQQIWNPELKIIDRCTTCHMGITIPGFEDAPQPYATHPDLAFWNKTHAFKDYGCTTCHSGQGYAVETADAHGEVHHWEDPMLSEKMAKSYGFESSAGLMETNCNVCHRRDEATPRMPRINHAKELVTQRGCIGCHILDGKNGGSIGPELTYEGSKHGEVFTMKGVKGTQSVFQWHREHFQSPSSISKGSIMPPVAFSDEDARDLALLVMSWRKTSIPMKYLPDSLKMQEIMESEKKGKK